MYYLVIFQFSAIHWPKLFNKPNVLTYLITCVRVLKSQYLDGILESILSSLEYSVVCDCVAATYLCYIWIVGVWACIGSCHVCIGKC